MTKDGATYYLGYDQVGTLKVVADASGAVVKRIEYDTFGNILSDSDASFAVPFGFAGGLCDKDTGLVRFGYRDYDPETGRWTAKDPILFVGGDTDLYGYCVNDPVNWIDPSGLTKGSPQHGDGPGTGAHPSIRKAKDALEANKDGKGRENARKILKKEINKLKKELKAKKGKQRTEVLGTLKILRALLKTALRNPSACPFLIIPIDPDTGLPVGWPGGFGGQPDDI